MSAGENILVNANIKPAHTNGDAIEGKDDFVTKKQMNDCPVMPVKTPKKKKTKKSLVDSAEELKKSLVQANEACDSSEKALKDANELWQSVRAGGKNAAADLGRAENARKHLEFCRGEHGRSQKKRLAIEMSIVRQNRFADIDGLKNNHAHAVEEAKVAREALRKQQKRLKSEIDKVRQTSQLELLKQARAAAVAKVKQAKKKLAEFSAKENGAMAEKKIRSDQTNGANGTSASSTSSNID